MPETVLPGLPTVQAKLDAFDALASSIERDAFHGVRLFGSAGVDQHDTFIMRRFTDERLKGLRQSMQLATLLGSWRWIEPPHLFPTRCALILEEGPGKRMVLGVNERGENLVVPDICKSTQTSNATQKEYTDDNRTCSAPS